MKKIIILVTVVFMALVCGFANAESNNIIDEVKFDKVIVKDVEYSNVIDLISERNEDGTITVTVVTVDRCFVHEALNWVDVTVYQNGLVPAWNWVSDAATNAWNWVSTAACDAGCWIGNTASSAWNWVTGLF